MRTKLFYHYSHDQPRPTKTNHDQPRPTTHLPHTKPSILFFLRMNVIHFLFLFRATIALTYDCTKILALKRTSRRFLFLLATSVPSEIFNDVVNANVENKPWLMAQALCNRTNNLTNNLNNEESKRSK